MTGPEHYREAERILAFIAARKRPMNGQTMPNGQVLAEMAIIDSDIREAQVHATLALAAATAQNIRRNGAADIDIRGWNEALG
jgi:hypothetical protein